MPFLFVNTNSTHIEKLRKEIVFPSAVSFLMTSVKHTRYSNQNLQNYIKIFPVDLEKVSLQACVFLKSRNSGFQKRTTKIFVNNSASCGTDFICTASQTDATRPVFAMGHYCEHRKLRSKRGRKPLIRLGMPLASQILCYAMLWLGISIWIFMLFL